MNAGGCDRIISAADIDSTPDEDGVEVSFGETPATCLTCFLPHRANSRKDWLVRRSRLTKCLDHLIGANSVQVAFGLEIDRAPVLRLNGFVGGDIARTVQPDRWYFKTAGYPHKTGINADVTPGFRDDR